MLGVLLVRGPSHRLDNLHDLSHVFHTRLTLDRRFQEPMRPRGRGLNRLWKWCGTMPGQGRCHLQMRHSCLHFAPTPNVWHRLNKSVLVHVMHPGPFGRSSQYTTGRHDINNHMTLLDFWVGQYFHLATGRSHPNLKASKAMPLQ